MFGGTWGKVVAAVALISTFGALNGWILIQGRIPLAAAEDGLFPARFGRLHGRRGTPVFALVVSSLLVTGLIAMNYNKALIDQFTFIILLATLTTVVPYAFAAAAEVYLFIVDPKRFAGRRVVRNIVVATLGFAYAIFAIWGIGWDIIGKGFLLLMIGLPVFVYMAWSRRRTRPTLEPAATTPPNVTEPAPLVGVGEVTVMTRRVLIMGAAGRDFHNFNVVYRDDPQSEVVAFTATQIPFISDRGYPTELAGPGTRTGSIYDEEELTSLIDKLEVDDVVFSYSDVSHEYVMHKASEVLAAGANFVLLGPEDTMLRAEVPVVAICAVRTGCGRARRRGTSPSSSSVAAFAPWRSVTRCRTGTSSPSGSSASRRCRTSTGPG